MVDQPAKDTAIRILGWMACSFRVLKCYELLDGIVLDARNDTLNTRTKVGKRIIDICRPLIEETPDGSIDFVHFSAKEYVSQFHSTCVHGPNCKKVYT